jgi:hypothetical protein
MFVTHEFDAQPQARRALQGRHRGQAGAPGITSAIDADESSRSVLDGKAIRVATMLTPCTSGMTPR